jgi:hypothetical protein
VNQAASAIGLVWIPPGEFIGQNGLALLRKLLLVRQPAQSFPRAGGFGARPLGQIGTHQSRIFLLARIKSIGAEEPVQADEVGLPERRLTERKANEWPWARLNRGASTLGVLVNPVAEHPPHPRDVSAIARWLPAILFRKPKQAPVGAVVVPGIDEFVGTHVRRSKYCNGK